MAPPKAVKQMVAAVGKTAAPEASNPTIPSGIDVPKANFVAYEGIISWSMSEINSLLPSCDGHIYMWQKNEIGMFVFNFLANEGAW